MSPYVEGDAEWDSIYNSSLGLLSHDFGSRAQRSQKTWVLGLELGVISLTRLSSGFRRRNPHRSLPIPPTLLLPPNHKNHWSLILLAEGCGIRRGSINE